MTKHLIIHNEMLHQNNQVHLGQNPQINHLVNLQINLKRNHDKNNLLKINLLIKIEKKLKMKFPNSLLQINPLNNQRDSKITNQRNSLINNQKKNPTNNQKNSQKRNLKNLLSNNLIYPQRNLLTHPQKNLKHQRNLKHHLRNQLKNLKMNINKILKMIKNHNPQNSNHLENNQLKKNLKNLLINRAFLRLVNDLQVLIDKVKQNKITRVMNQKLQFTIQKNEAMTKLLTVIRVLILKKIYQIQDELMNYLLNNFQSSLMNTIFNQDYFCEKEFFIEKAVIIINLSLR